MSDNLNKKQPLDAFKINIHESYELKYWTKALNVSEDELKSAIKTVGPQASKVRQYLNKK